MRQRLIAGNWKMNGSLNLVEEFSSYFDGITFDAEVVVIPPSLYVSAFKLKKTDSYQLGVQNLSEHSNGAYTGELSGTMAEEFDVSYVLCGHSERRQYYGESSRIVAKKVASVLASTRIQPILCLGESLDEREAGREKQVLKKQLVTVLDKINENSLDRLILAYEPVWAIGTGKTATPEEAQSIHEYLRETVRKYDEAVAERMLILYGGSVNNTNINHLLAKNDIDGALVGGASLEIKKFYKICELAG